MNDQGFRRELGLFDAAVVVAGGIIGVGIFANPANVARVLERPALILLAWAIGGVVALLGGFVWAELGSRMPEVGGQYAYLTRAYHPVVGFLYGVALLCIINGGGLAAVAILFATYVDRTFVPVGPHGVTAVAAAAILVLTFINVIGVRAGTRTNNVLMAAKVGGMVALVSLAFVGGHAPASDFRVADLAMTPSTVPMLFTALVPVLFAFGGWQNCGAMAAEIRDPARNLARANVLGVLVVVVLYLSLNVAYLWVLPPAAVAASPALAADVARAVAGAFGAQAVATLIVISSLGFLAVIIMTSPRLYYAMASDGLLPARVATLHPRYRTPATALWLQAGLALLLLASNTYDQLLSYVVFADWLFFGLTAAAVFRLRAAGVGDAHAVPTPGHPWTTLAFVLVAAGVVFNSFFAYRAQSMMGSGILLVAAVIYVVVQARRRA